MTQKSATVSIPTWFRIPLVLLFCALPLMVAYRLHDSLPYDDAFITFTYARSLAEGKGFVYNAGQPFLGTTTPLLTLILAFLHVLLPSIEIFTVAKWLGAMLWACGGFVGYRLARGIAGDLAGIAVAALFTSSALYPYMLGSEYPLVMVLCLLAVWYAYRRRPTVTGVVLGLAFLARGDTAILAALIGMIMLVRDRRIPWRLIIGFGIAILPWFVYAAIVFGNPLPATLSIKSAHRALKAWPHLYVGFWRWWLTSGPWFQRWTVAVSILALLGLAFSVFKRRVWSGLIAVWGLLYAVAYVLLDVPYYFWYGTPLFSALAVEAGFGLGFLYEFLRPRPSSNRPDDQASRDEIGSSRRIASSRSRKIIAVAIPLILSGLVLWLGYTTIQRATKGLLQASSREIAYVATGQWLAENTPPESTVAFIEVGWVGYFSHREVLDLLGLTSPGTAKYLKARDHAGLFEMLDPDYYVRNTAYDAWGMNVGVHESKFFQENYYQLTEIDQPGQKPVLIYERKGNLKDRPAHRWLPSISS